MHSLRLDKVRLLSYFNAFVLCGQIGFWSFPLRIMVSPIFVRKSPDSRDHKYIGEGSQASSRSVQPVHPEKLQSLSL